MSLRGLLHGLTFHFTPHRNQSGSLWFNGDSLKDVDYVDDEYKDSISLLRGMEEELVSENGDNLVDGQWTNEQVECQETMYTLDFSLRIFDFFNVCSSLNHLNRLLTVRWRY